jgi:tetratricopeptide (TPR) repeat protein
MLRAYIFSKVTRFIFSFLFTSLVLCSGLHAQKNQGEGDKEMCVTYFNKAEAYDKISDLVHANEYYTKAIECNPLLVQAYYNRGVNRSGLKDMKGALSDLNKFIKMDSTFSDSYAIRGLVKLNMSDTTGALADYDKAIEYKPNSDQAYIKRGSLKRIQRDLDGALMDFNLAVSLNSKNINAYYFRGYVKSELKNYKDAILDFNKCLELDTTWAAVYKARGFAKEYIDTYGAMEDYSKAIKLDTADNKIYFNRGMLRKGIKDYIGAIDDFNHAITINPKNHRYYYQKALSEQEIKEFGKSVTDLDKAIELNKPNAKYYFNRGFSKYRLKNYTQAIEDLNLAISIDSSDGEFYYFRGLCFYKTDDFSKALEYYNKAEKLYKQGPNETFLVNRGNVKKELKQYLQAIEDYSGAIKILATYSNAYLYRGQTKLLMEDYDGAIADFDSVIKITPGDPTASYWIGKTEMTRGNYAKALPYYNSLIINEPANSLLLSERGRIKENLNDKEGAKKDFSEARRIDSLSRVPTLKNKLTESDLADLRRQALKCFTINPNVSFTITSQDVMPNLDPMAGKASSLKEAEKLEEKFKQDPANYSLSMRIGSIYKELKKREQASKYFNLTLDIINDRIKKSPNDSTLYSALGYLYLKLEDLQQARNAFDKYLAKKPGAEEILFFQAMISYMLNDNEKVNRYCKEAIRKHPLNADVFILLSFSIIADSINAHGNKNEDSLLFNKIEDVAHFYLLDSICKKYPDNFSLKLTYQFSRHVVFMLKLATEPEPTAYDKEQIKLFESFYTEAVKRKDSINKYLIYKCLGDLFLFTKQFKKAIPYYEKAIKQKSPKQSSSISNADAVYSHLEAAYLLAGDTSNAEKIIKRRIAKRPEIELQSKDYVSLAAYYFHYKDLKTAASFCNKALEIDPLSKKAYIGLSAINLYDNKLKEAMDYCYKASSMGSESEITDVLSAIILLHDGEVKYSYDFLNKAKQIDDSFEVPQEILDKYFEK